MKEFDHLVTETTYSVPDHKILGILDGFIADPPDSPSQAAILDAMLDLYRKTKMEEHFIVQNAQQVLDRYIQNQKR